MVIVVSKHIKEDIIPIILRCKLMTFPLNDIRWTNMNSATNGAILAIKVMTVN